jgi:hypothetical protein
MATEPEKSNLEAPIRWGLLRTFFTDGRVASKGNYADGKKTGEWIYYYNNGVVKAKGYYQNDRSMGTWKWWHENGQLKQTGSFDENELKTSTWQRFHPNGALWDKGEYTGGKKIVEWKTYNDEGQCVKTRVWKLLDFDHPNVRRSQKEATWLIVQWIAILIVVGGLVNYFFRPFDREFRRALPYAATEIHESTWNADFLPDYTYCLKAKITRAAFKTYVAKFDLKLQQEDSAIRSGFEEIRPAWGAPHVTVDWWDVTRTMDSTYYSWPKLLQWTVAKYEHGYLYLYSQEW